MNKWYIGQRIVAIKNHSQGVFKKGDEFIIKGLKDGLCQHSNILIDIGIKSIYGYNLFCRLCNKIFDIIDDKWWFYERCFAPLQQKQELSSVTLEEILEEISEKETCLC